MTNKIPLTGLLPEQIAEFFPEEPAFRSKQVFKWVYSAISTIDDMTNLSKDFRTLLADKTTLRTSSISQRLEDPDKTVKLQIELSDGNAVETVLLTDEEDRKTACVSCQVGCAMGCAFCKTGTLGFSRNLSAAEIVEQFLFLEEECGKLDNIVFMGMGEPLLNLDNIRLAIDILSHPQGRNLSKRRITLSTAGIISGIYDITDNGPPVRLAVSLTTATQSLRESLMPITKSNSLNDLRKAIAYYTEKTGNRCTLETVLLAEENTTDTAIDDLIFFTKGLNVHVNLIPWNPAPGLAFKEPSANQTAYVRKKLEKAGVNVTIRARRGRKIGGACGQLGKIK